MLKGGLIGAERLGTRRESWAGIDGLSLVAVSEDPFSATANGALKRYDSADALLRTGGLDFVDIAGPIADRCRHIETAARHDVAVFCAPPLANDASIAERAIAACDRADVVLCVDHSTRFQPAVLALRSALDDGLVGTVNYGHIRFRGGGASATDGDAQNVRPLVVFDLLDLARLLLGDTERVHVRAQGQGLVTCALDHEDGAISMVDWSFATIRAPGSAPHLTARIEGEAGTLELAEDGSLLVSGRGQRTTLVESPDADADFRLAGMAALRRHFADCLKENDTPEPSGEDHMETHRLWQRVAASGKTGRAA